MSIQNLCDTGLTALVENCKTNPITIQNTTLCNDLEEANILYKNAKFYYSTNEYQGALVSYSCASVLLNSISRQLAETNTEMKSQIDDILNCCLRAVDVLLEKTRKIKQSSNKDDEDGEKEWDKICVKIKPLVFSAGSSNCLFFSDVAGLFEEKKTFESSLIYPLMYPNLYPKRSKGILLYGPPGTGKTYVVKAAVNELQLKGGKSVGVLFFAPSPGDLKGKYVGETEKRIEEIFTCASRAACNHELNCKNGKKYISIIFMDEFDAIAPDREQDSTGLAANSVNTLLQMMDGINSKPNVAVVAATNFPWNLDNAILRRFDTQILVDLPQEGDMLELLNNEMKQTIQIKPEKSEYSYCEQEEKKEAVGSKKKEEETENLQCNIQCENKPAQELYMTAPYNKVIIDYYADSSNNGGFFRGIIKKMAMENFSNSDISRMFKAAATNAGELAVKANLFYNASLIDYNLKPERYISCITKMADEDKAIERSIKLLESYKSGNMGKETDYYQLQKPDIVSIEYNGYNYYNVKCLFYKSNELIIDHPLIKDVYVKCNKTIDNKTIETIDVQTYKSNVLGYLKTKGSFSPIDVIISFNFTFKETSNNTNEMPIFPVSSQLINKVFNPIYNGVNSIRKTAEDKEIFKEGDGKQWLKTTYGVDDAGFAELLSGAYLFNIYGKTCGRELVAGDESVMKPYVQTIIKSPACDISAKINGLVQENFDIKKNNYDYLKFLLLYQGGNNYFKNLYIKSVLPAGTTENFKFIASAEINNTYDREVIFQNDDEDQIITKYNGTHILIKINDYLNTILYKEIYENVKFPETIVQMPSNVSSTSLGSTSGENSPTAPAQTTIGGAYPTGTTENTYIQIEKELFKILMRSSFGYDKLLSDIERITGEKESFYVFDKNQIQKYFIESSQSLIQLYFNDILNFFDLANEIYKNDNAKKTLATKLFTSYIQKLLQLEEQDLFLNLEQLSCLRIFDNYNFAKENKITDPDVKIGTIDRTAENTAAKAAYQSKKIARNIGKAVTSGIQTAANTAQQLGQTAVTENEESSKYIPSDIGLGYNEYNYTGLGGGGGKKKFKLHKKPKFNSKNTKRNNHKSTFKTRKNKNAGGIPEELVENVEVEEEETQMGGADTYTYDKFIRFCINNSSTESSIEKIADKNIFIATSYDINKVKTYRRDGLLNDLFYGSKGLIESVSDYLNPSAKSKDLKTEENINKMKTKNQYLPFIFKNFKAIGFMGEIYNGNPKNEIVNDSTLIKSQSTNVKILWSKMSNDTMVKEWLNKLKQIIAGIKGTAKAGLGVGSNSVVNLIGVIASSVGTNYLGSNYFYGYAATALAANIYNFIYAEDVKSDDILNEDEMISNVILPTIFNIITDIRYVETQKFEITPNKAFSNALEKAINSLGLLTIGLSETGSTNTTITPTSLQINLENAVVKQDMQEKLTNLNIPFKSFSYAMTVVKSTYVAKNVTDLRLYKNNKDKFMDQKRKEKK